MLTVYFAFNTQYVTVILSTVYDNPQTNPDNPVNVVKIINVISELKILIVKKYFLPKILGVE